MSKRRHNLKGLLSAYGFTPAEHFPDQKRTRYRDEYTFIDVWEGRRGTTVGIFQPKGSRMKYLYRTTDSVLEDELVRLKNNHG